MRFSSVLAILVLLLVAVSCSQAALLQRRQRELYVTEINEEQKEDAPVAIIEVQEPDTVVQSLQVDTAIQTTDNNAAEQNEQEFEVKDTMSVETFTNSFEVSTLTDKLEVQTDAEELRKIEKISQTPTEIPVNPPSITPQKIFIAQDPAAEALSFKATGITEIPADTTQDLTTDTYKEVAVRQASQATTVQSTTPQNFVQFIQSSPIGQFFSQLTGGQQQTGSQGTPVTGGDNQESNPANPTVPVFLNPGAALTQAQQAVQNAAQSVVNTTTQAFQGLQQFASNIGNQFQNTLSSLSGQNQQNAADSTSARPTGPIQSVINNLVGNPGSSTAAPTVNNPQRPFQGIISFFQGGPRPQNSNSNITEQPNNNKPVKVENNQSINNLEDKIDNEIENNNEVRNSEETLDSLEDTQNGQQLIVVNDDTSLRTEQTTTA